VHDYKINRNKNSRKNIQELAIAQIQNGKNPRDSTSIKAIWYKEIG